MNVKEVLEKSKQSKFLAEGDTAVRLFMDSRIKELTQQAIDQFLPRIVAEVTEYVKDEVATLEDRLVKGIKKGDKGEKGMKGDRGLVGPPGDPGKHGKDGVDGRDANEEVVAKKVLGMIPKPIDGKDGINGSPDTPIQIAEKLNTLEEKVDITVIRGLQKTIQVLQRNIQDVKKRDYMGGGGGSSSGGTWYTEVPTGTIDGANMTFTVANTVGSSGKSMFLLYNGQVQEYGTHFTVSGSTITMTFAPETGSALFAMYT